MTRTSNFMREKVSGTKVGNKRQLVIRIDDETLDEIVALAHTENVSVAEQVRVLIEFGLEDVKNLA